MAGRYGLMGSEYVSKKSSILLVCSLMASSGDGSFVEDELEGPGPKDMFCWLPRW